MSDNAIQCPKCGTDISLNDALTVEVKDQ